MSWIRARVSFALLRSALTLTSREDKQIFLENIEDDIFISYFLSFFVVDFHI